jgi:hypothetical protein
MARTKSLKNAKSTTILLEGEVLEHYRKLAKIRNQSLGAVLRKQLHAGVRQEPVDDDEDDFLTDEQRKELGLLDVVPAWQRLERLQEQMDEIIEELKAASETDEFI